MSTNPLLNQLAEHAAAHPAAHVDPNPGISRKLTVNTTLNDAASRNGLNQIRGTAKANSLGSGIPKHVSNVHALTNVASTGATTSIGVTFHQDPSDENFAGVDIFVKGYQNNNSLTKVGGGAGSPVNFVLNNTGERVTLVVQARGNTGAAPITGAPSVAVNLGQSTIGGFGLSALTGITSVTASAGQSIVTAPTSVANVVAQAGLLSTWTLQKTIQFPGSIAFDVLPAATAGVCNVLLLSGTTSSKPNGYVFVFDARSGSQPCYVCTMVAGNWTAIGTANIAVNAADISGWHSIRVETSVTNNVNSFSMYLNGVLAWTATSSLNTLFQNTPTYTGEQIAHVTISPAGKTQFNTDNLPNGIGTFLPTPGTAFAQGTQAFDNFSAISTLFSAGGISGNACNTPPMCLSWQAWTNGASALGIGVMVAGGNTGYAFTIDGTSGNHRAVIGRIDSLTAGTIVTLASSTGTNASNIIGWADCHAFISDKGLISLYVNGLLAATANDTTYINTLNGTTKAWTGSATACKLGPSPAAKVGSTFLNQQGNLSTSTANTFTYATTSTSIKWTWTAFTLYGADGSSISVAANSTGTTFSGLTASTSYKFAFYVTIATGVCTVAKSDVSAGVANFSSSFAQTVINGDGNSGIAINVTAATPASGTGGGTGGTVCFSPNTKVKTQRGDVAISAITPTDFVLTARGTWCRVLGVTVNSWDGPACNMGGEEFGTPGHFILHNSKWVRLATLLPTTHYSGTVHNLHVDTDPADDGLQADTEHSYTLSNGRVAHNVQPVC